MKQSTKRRIASKAQKPDSTRLHVLGVNVAPPKKHSQPRRLVWTTVVNSGKTYPYNSHKRAGLQDGPPIPTNWGA